MAQKQQVTKLAIKVDLGCDKCRKKIKKILCEIPQIQDQVYDDKTNTVIVKVVCCSPDKVKKKICCKGGKIIKGIEIVKPPPPPKPKEPEKPPEKPKEAPPPPPPAEKPKEPPAPPPAEKPPKKKEPEKPPPPPPPEKPKEPPPPPPPEKPKEPPPPPPPPKQPEPPPPPPPAPGGLCCIECYQGHGGGPCWGRPAPVGPCYEYYGGYGRPVYDSWGGGGSYCYRGTYYTSRCTDYICEENPSACSIM